jgi:hypothetical protein
MMITACFTTKMLNFLQRFEQLASPLGAILNKEKTCIMTTTGESLIPRMKNGTSMRQLMAALALDFGKCHCHLFYQ